jgi:hypothetical protein
LTQEHEEEIEAEQWRLEEQKQLFSRVRHNKVVEVEEMLMAGTQARHALSRPSGACVGCMSQYAQADMRDEFGNSPLIVACQNGHKRCAKLLIKAGANVNSQNHRGNTALHYAHAYGYTSLSKYLVNKGADDTILNASGLTPYEGC